MIRAQPLFPVYCSACQNSRQFLDAAAQSSVLIPCVLIDVDLFKKGQYSLKCLCTSIGLPVVLPLLIGERLRSY